MNSLTSLFSSDMNLDSNPPVQTGGASGMTILMGLLICCSVFCIALLGINNWRIDFVFTSGANVGLMFAMMGILSFVIIYLAFQGQSATSAPLSYNALMSPESGFDFRRNMSNMYRRTL